MRRKQASFPTGFRVKSTSNPDVLNRPLGAQLGVHGAALCALSGGEPVVSEKLDPTRRKHMPTATLASAIKAIRLYTSAEWELFVEEWLRGLKKRYAEVKRLGGSGDLARDVVAFTDAKRLEGIWDNYQCKHYERPLPASIAGAEIAKLVYFAFLGRFKPPRHMYFVAPRDVSTELSDLLNSPSKLRSYVEQHWDKSYANTIIEGQSITLSGPLVVYVADFDFSIFSYYQTSEMLDDHRNTARWAERFGGLLLPPPTCQAT